MTVCIVTGAAADTLALRQAVLRPHQQAAEILRPGDADPRAAHVCALDEEDRCVGVGSTFPEPPPWNPGAPGSWRIVGMATAEGRRGAGVGGAVLSALLAHCRAHGGELVWCNARLGARSFYERAGFTTHGEPWEEPVIGPHVAMVLDLGAATG
jgi:GNAT superfamily N-acetyltransferase